MRVDELPFAHPAALYRGDGTGVAAIERQHPVDSGPSWARVNEAGAGIDGGFVYLQYHGGDVAVFAVDGSASAEPPADAHLDPRLRALGDRFEVHDVEEARRADAASGAKLRDARTVIAAESFEVTGIMDGRRWRVRVGPALPGGATTLESRAEDGELRLVETQVDRATLKRARVEPVIVAGTYPRRRRLGGVSPHSIEVELRPDER